MALRKVTSDLLKVTRHQPSLIPAARQQVRCKTGWGLQGLKNFPELIPLFAILGCAVLGAATMSVYALVQKSDVNVMKKEIPPWERVNPFQKQKLLTINTEYKPIDGLEELRKEIGSYRT